MPLALAGAVGSFAHAAPPALETLFPCGGRIGATATVTATGSKLDKEFPEVWADHAGIVFKKGAKPKTFEVSIAADVPPGPHLVRFFNKEGASVPHVFVAGTHDEFTDTEPNDDHLNPQAIAKLSATVHGRLEKSGDVDTFAVELEAGKTFTAELQGYALGSQMDPAMKLLDARGVEVALSHDTHNLDPFIRYEVKQAGKYLVQLMAFAHPPAADVSLKGSSGHIYRLTLTDRPFARFATPCAVTRGQQATVTTAHGEVTADASRSAMSDQRLAVPAADGEIVFAALVKAPVSIEAEPNNDTKSAQRLTPPFAVSGTLSQPADEDRFVFHAKKGETLAIRVHAATVHSPLDASLRIEDTAGKVLEKDDDSEEANPDPAISFKPPADGDYVAVVSDLFQRGGPDVCYALEVAPPQFQVTGTLTQNAAELAAGKTIELKASVKIVGKLQGKLRASAEALPPGVALKDVEIPAKGGDVKLVLSATPEAAAASVPIEFQFSTSAPDEAMTFKAAYDLRGTEPRGDRLVNEDSRVWLTVTPK